MNNYPGAVITNILPLASRTASGKGVDIDALSMNGSALVMHVAAVAVAGTSPTWDVTLQDSDEVAVGSLANTTAGAVDISLRHGATDNIKLGYAWTQSGVRQIKYAYLRLKRLGAITGGKIVKVGIFANSTGDPGSQLGAYSASVSASAMSTAYSWVKFTFATPIDLADATVYHIVLEGDYDVSATVQVQWRILTVASGGLFNIFDSGWGGAVTTQSAEVYLEEYNFTDITNDGITSGIIGAATALLADERIWQVNTDTLKRFLRAAYTITGSNSPQFYAGVAMISRDQSV